MTSLDPRTDGRAATTDVDLRPRRDPSGGDASIGELLAKTTHDLSDLFRAEVELAKTELRDEAKEAGRAGAMLGAGGLLAYLALALLCFAAAWGLAAVLPEGVAFLIVAVVVGGAAAVLLLSGKNKVTRIEPVPHQTVETIQEDVAWARQLRN